MKPIKKRIILLLLFLISLIALYFAWFFLMDAPIPFSEEAQQKNGLYHSISILIFIFSSILYFFVKKKI